jgi:hypothetical protein
MVLCICISDVYVIYVIHSKEANLQLVLSSSQKWMVTFTQLVSSKLIDNVMDWTKLNCYRLHILNSSDTWQIN